jgi:hypothetical protein
MTPTPPGHSHASTQPTSNAGANATSPTNNGHKATSKKHSYEALTAALGAVCALAALHEFDKSCINNTPYPRKKNP